MVENLVLTIAIVVIGCIAVRGLVWLATVGDERWSRRREAMRIVRQYKPPTNSRPQDFDQRGRPW